MIIPILFVGLEFLIFHENGMISFVISALNKGNIYIFFTIMLDKQVVISFENRYT
ncbi:hypothetical protein [Alkalibacterium sp. 20]|uniref:hypothetical protein n=1 Tax=Alkalibacterium sp. 20 TaxID=1798803 RepID=UPI0035276496